ncbi:MAG: FliH/SctL family protein [Pedobacter sp.]
MAMFDTSEMLVGNPHDVAEQDASQEPTGVTLTEEELNQRVLASFDSGLQEGKNLAERGLLNVFKSLRTAAEDLYTLREKVLRESEDELVKLIMMVARKVILREVVQDRRILSDVVQAAIAGLSERDEIIIRLNPDDYALVTTSREDFLRKELLTDRMQLKPDSSVLPGSCKIDTEMGTIDAGIDAQLDEIFRRLLEERSMSTGVGA